MGCVQSSSDLRAGARSATADGRGDPNKTILRSSSGGRGGKLERLGSRSLSRCLGDLDSCEIADEDWPSHLPRLPASSHLLLGLTTDSLEKFKVDELRFLEEGTDDYTRDEVELGFVTRDYGPSRTGYDFAAKVRSWLRQTNNEKYSVCQVLRNTGDQGVGRATAFWSHVQRQCINKTILQMREACDKFPELLDARFWVDSTSLRPCQTDNDLTKIHAAIVEIGTTVIEIPYSLDEPLQAYLKRAWCLYEVVTSAVANNKLFFASQQDACGVGLALTRSPVESRLSEVNGPSASGEKRKIDDYMSTLVGGSAEADAIITKAITDVSQVGYAARSYVKTAATRTRTMSKSSSLSI